MTELETELELVQCDTRQRLVYVTRQKARVVSMRKAGRSTSLTEEMLQILDYLQTEYEAHLNRLAINERRNAIFRDCDRIFATI